MKEPNLGLMAYNLLDTALALAGILDQTIEGKCIRVNYQFATQLITAVQMTAKSAADELLLIRDEKEVALAEKGGAE